jgi:hypothetical protein
MKLRLPEPCTAEWDAMEIRPGGRFCQTCKKTLIDFAGMTRSQAKARLKLVRGNKVCGRIAVHPDTGEAIFAPDPHRTVRWAGGVVLAAALTSTGCGRDEPNQIRIEPEVVTIASIPLPPMRPIEHWAPQGVGVPGVTRAVPAAELEAPDASAAPTAEQQLLTENKQRRVMVRGRIGF